MWIWVLDNFPCSQLKTRRRKPSQGKSLLPFKDRASGLGKSAAVHFVQKDLLGFGDEPKSRDNDHAVVKTVEKLPATRGDTLVSMQEKEARSVGGTISQ